MPKTSTMKKRAPRRRGGKRKMRSKILVVVLILAAIVIALSASKDGIFAMIEKQIAEISSQVATDITSHIATPTNTSVEEKKTPSKNTNSNSSNSSSENNDRAVVPRTQSSNSQTQPLGQNDIRVHFIDLGQADAILIQSRENAVLIDGGEYQTRNRLIRYLRDLNISTLDYVVATHPHSDHIGGLAPVLRGFDVRRVIMPDAVNNTASFEHLISAIEEKNIPVTVPNVGDRVNAGIIRMTVLAPGARMREDNNLNNRSIVLRMVHNQISFLFTGDAEKESEQEMLEGRLTLRSDVLKAGHHGSRTSTTRAFLDAVRPSVVVVMCGRRNRYGHPHREFLSLVGEADRGITLFRTDEIGNVVITTDGRKLNY